MSKKIINKRFIFVIGTVFFLLATSSLSAAAKIQRGKVVDKEIVPYLSPEQHYCQGLELFSAGNYREAAKHLNILSVNFPLSEEGKTANYYLGVCSYHLGEYDCANEALTRYIKGVQYPEFFEEAIQYKFCIAEHFRNGAKRRFYGSKHLPKWAPSSELALEIYDEVALAMPIADIAASALYAKGELQWKMRCFREAVEAYQMLIKRFPKHELAPEAYLTINKVYLDQSTVEFQNPDIIAFAELNVLRFRRDFPKEPRIAETENVVHQIKEVYANGLYDTGLFYEKTERPGASILYYQKAIVEFPETAVALRCRERLSEIAPELVEESVGEDFEYTTAL